MRERSRRHRKADRAQRTPGAREHAALRQLGFPAYETRKPVRYAMCFMYALPPAQMIRYLQRERKGASLRRIPAAMRGAARDAARQMHIATTSQRSSRHDE